MSHSDFAVEPGRPYSSDAEGGCVYRKLHPY